MNFFIFSIFVNKILIVGVKRCCIDGRLLFIEAYNVLWSFTRGRGGGMDVYSTRLFSKQDFVIG